MDTDYIINELKKNSEVFSSLLSGTTSLAIRWKPSPDKWCLLEVIGHLNDEEMEDFRPRIDIILNHPGDRFKSIDPPAWVAEHHYMEKDLREVLGSFLEQRKRSVEWLKGLSNAAWNNQYLHPSLGVLTAGMLLSNWLAHDYIHIRQITRLKYEFLKSLSNQDLGYAGNW